MHMYASICHKCDVSYIQKDALVLYPHTSTIQEELQEKAEVRSQVGDVWSDENRLLKHGMTLCSTNVSFTVLKLMLDKFSVVETNSI